MKVIDLLNKIANNEIKKGTKFEIDGCRYTYNNGYIIKDDGNKTMETFYISQILLNDEVEIIEEEQDIEELNIQRVWQDNFRNEPLLRYMYKEDIKDIENKINELIKAVNELKKNER